MQYFRVPVSYDKFNERFYVRSFEMPVKRSSATLRTSERKNQSKHASIKLFKNVLKAIKKNFLGFTFAIATYVITKFVQNDFGKTVSAMI